MPDGLKDEREIEGANETAEKRRSAIAQSGGKHVHQDHGEKE
jgi:hypothetical protein